ncbi:hypothetical protein U9M48_026594, partial [Paspalum notatum var. saurae]
MARMAPKDRDATATPMAYSVPLSALLSSPISANPSSGTAQSAKAAVYLELGQFGPRRVFFTVASANLLVATGTLQSAQIHDKKDYQ